MRDDMILLEYSPKSKCFHYNRLNYVSGTRGYYAISLCTFELANKFTEAPENNDCYTEGVTFDEVCRRWERYFNEHRDDFLKIGMR